jgi:hypothetical protein
MAFRRATDLLSLTKARSGLRARDSFYRFKKLYDKANELRKRGLTVSPAGVRCVWQRQPGDHDQAASAKANGIGVHQFVTALQELGVGGA